MNLEDRIQHILRETKTIATVGFSSSPHKPSHYVPRYLMEHGYRVIPVNPNADEILGEKAYPSLAEVPEEVDMVQLFRPSDEVAPHVEQAIEMGARFLWLQLGIRNEEAAAVAREAGLEVIQDRCMMVDHRRIRSQL
ncbi:MAG: CoA-binding protein [Anaerolineales bacterium]